MALILNIDTATEKAGICLSKDGEAVQIMHHNDQKDHAAWLHAAIKKMMLDTGYAMKYVEAVAVTAGPGSYTGLRVGLATAKGICYALNIPLITENTLKLMAFAATQQGNYPAWLLCPMIDARRMEVFTAIYNYGLEELMPPTAMVLDESSFSDRSGAGKLVFFGSGSKKWQLLSKSTDFVFTDVPISANYLGILSYDSFKNRQFTDIIYSEPAYTKEFYTHTKK